jgi:hypothetical protein
MLVAAGHDHGAQKRHGNHDENLHFIGSEQGQPEQVTADDVREVQQHRNDECERQRKLNDPGEPVQSFVDHRVSPSR